MRELLDAITVGGTCLTAVNTFLIWRLHDDKDNTIKQLLAALLQTNNEPRAAAEIRSATKKPVVTDDTRPPHMRPRQVGMTGR